MIALASGGAGQGTRWMALAPTAENPENAQKPVGDAHREPPAGFFGVWPTVDVATGGSSFVLPAHVIWAHRTLES